MKLTKIFSREYSVQYTEMSLKSLAWEVKEFLPSLITRQIYIPEQGNETCCVYLSEWQTLLTMLDNVYSDKKLLENFFVNFHNYGQQYIAIAKEISVGSFKELSNEDLVERYEKYQQALLQYTVHLWMGYLLNNIYTDKIKDILSVKNIGNYEEVFSVLLSPTKLSGVLSLQEELTSLKKSGQELTEEQINNFLLNYQWISCLDMQNDPWSKHDLLNFWQNIKFGQEQISFEQAVKMAGLDDVELELIKLARILVYIKDMRDEYRRQGVFYSINFFDELATRLGLKRKELAYFTQSEITNILVDKQKLSKTVALARQAGFLIYRKERIITVSSDEKEIKKYIEENVLFDKEDNNILTGTVACAGVVEGIVKIVLGIKDLAKVKSGDVMVAITTHPDFVIAMHDSVAVITEEGGLTSHAAIISREIGIPCLVGMKNATKILQDGQLVRVDANKGIVEII